MDKDRRARRYRRKDYRELVEFPVEIVGRDGAVRRYDFEDSVRLYQRRLHFAPVRFGEEDLVTAEQGHCRARIEQLRHSYFVLFGWAGTTGPHVDHPLHAGELVSFLQRALRCRERLDLTFSPVPGGWGADAQLCNAWFVERPMRAGGLLLYCFGFEEGADDAAQARFASLLAELRAPTPVKGDAEQLIAWRHANDCAFVLTGRADEVAAVAAVAPEGDDAGGMEPTPWDEAVQYLRRGDLPTSFLRCRWIVDDQPWHRDAYVLGMALALVLRRGSDAEDLGFVGSAYVPKDPLIRYFLALSQVHQQRMSAGRAAAEVALITSGQGGTELGAARNLLAWTQVLDRSMFQAWRTLGAAPVGSAEPFEHDFISRGLLQTWLRAWGLTVVLVVLSGLWLGVGVVAQSVPALVISLVGWVAVMPAVAWLRTRGRLLHHRLRVEDPQLVLKRIDRLRATEGR
jgi:hypothetical protein